MKLIKHINIDKTTGVLLLDGEPFGYYLAAEALNVTLNENGADTIQITLIADRITVTNEG